jgi:hypothetical protein
MAADIDDQDQKWLDALEKYAYGTLPFWKNSEGYIDAAKTLDEVLQGRGLKKIDADGNEIE